MALCRREDAWLRSFNVSAIQLQQPGTEAHRGARHAVVASVTDRQELWKVFFEWRWWVHHPRAWDGRTLVRARGRVRSDEEFGVAGRIALCSAADVRGERECLPTRRTKEVLRSLHPAFRRRPLDPWLHRP